MEEKRIVSFLPSATELIYELGAEEKLHGVTHECEYPIDAKNKPRVIESVFDPEKMSSKEIDDKITLLLSTSSNTGIDVREQIEKLTDQLTVKTQEIYGNLDRWQIVQLSRHPERPHASDYISAIADYWLELHGDRLFSDDSSILSGIAVIENNKFISI